METVYLASVSHQPKEIEKYCFELCGQVFLGALRIGNFVFVPCKQKTCKFEEARQDMGRAELDDGNIYHLIVRKLKKEMKK